MNEPGVSDREFEQFRTLLYGIAGIHLSEAKKPLLYGRLAQRVRARKMPSYAAYYELVTSGDAAELETCVNLLTTNETFFFREPKHFDVLRTLVADHAGKTPFRVWSAACSTGEEPYTIAMVLADALGLDGAWDVFGSDISTHVLAKAAAGRYAMERSTNIPTPLLRAYCLKGVGAHAGTFAIDAPLRARVSFGRINLNTELPQIGPFDVVFLRNALIYFDQATKRDVVGRLAQKLKPSGCLFIGHSESLNGVTEAVQPMLPTVYRKAR